MLRKKKKYKHELPDGEINITSLMDILTTLLFFILMVMSLQNFSVIESTSLTSSTSESKDDKPIFTLQVTLQDQKNASIWLGPIKGLENKIVNRSNLLNHLQRSFKGSETAGYSKNIKGDDLKDLLKKVQDALIGIKQGFPNEHKAVVSFTDKIKYQELINSLSAVRELAPKDESFIITDLKKDRFKTKVLFPEVIIAEETIEGS